MLIAIMQPTFLPWLGYFDMIRRADTFVFLDDVQLSPKGWQIRNRIPKGDDSFEWLKVKVSNDVPLKQRLLNCTKIRDGMGDLDRIRSQIEKRYGVSSDALSEISEVLRTIESTTSISEINIEMIQKLCSLLSIHSDFLKSSELGVSGNGSRKVLNLLKQLGATRYLVAPGSVSYMKLDPVWAGCEEMCIIHNYESEPYYQRGCKKFVSNMSVIDAILQLGVRTAADVLIAGTRTPIAWK